VLLNVAASADVGLGPRLTLPGLAGGPATHRGGVPGGLRARCGALAAPAVPRPPPDRRHALRQRVSKPTRLQHLAHRQWLHQWQYRHVGHRCGQRQRSRQLPHATAELVPRRPGRLFSAPVVLHLDAHHQQPAYDVPFSGVPRRPSALLDADPGGSPTGAAAPAVSGTVPAHVHVCGGHGSARGGLSVPGSSAQQPERRPARIAQAAGSAQHQIKTLFYILPPLSGSRINLPLVVLW
jgi:hypothetical protein